MISMLKTAVTSLRLLHSIHRRPYGPRVDVAETELSLGASGDEATRFEPRVQPRRTLVLVHGVTGRAHRDPLLVHLARSLGALGYRCIVPGLRHLSNFEHDAHDIQTVVRAIELASRCDGSRVGILAFSYGSSYALCAAADDRVAHLCSALIGFGAYYDLGDALEHQQKLLASRRDPAQDEPDLAYLRYTLLACHRSRLGLSDEAWQAIQPVIVDFTSAGPVEQKRAPLLRYARDVDYVALMQRYRERDLSAALSPAGCLERVRCRVGLLHDPDDRFVPSTHAEFIRRALDTRPGCVPTQVLRTRMLSHVEVDPTRQLRDLPRLIGLLDPLLGSRA